MVNNPEPEASDLERVEQLLLDSLECPEDSQADRIESLCTEHPDLAEELRVRFAQLRELGLAGRTDDRMEPRRLGGYRLIRPLGKGGMGVVYLAEQESTQREVALKLLRPGLLDVDKAHARFHREVQAAARLEHRGICPVHEAGEHDGVPFIAMRYLQGETLAARIARLRDRDEPVGVHDAVELIAAVARALHAAHEVGLVHRDVKPSNIMIGPDGEPVLFDFGLVRDSTDDHASLTLSTDVLGTPAYMAPEQITGELPVAPAADIYALGVVLYEILTLHCPFEAPTREALYRQILGGDITRAQHHNRAIQRDLEIVLHTALDRDPQRRYRTALDLAEDLRRVRERLPIRARPTPVALRAKRWCQRNPSVAVSVLALTAGLVVSLLLLASRNSTLHRLRIAGLIHASAAEIPNDPVLGLLLARKAAELDWNSDTYSQLQEALAAVRQVRSLTGHTDVVNGITLAPDGQSFLSYAQDGTARLWSMDGSRLAVLRHDKPVTSAEFSPSGEMIVTACQDGMVRIWTCDGDNAEELSSGGQAINRAVFSPVDAGLLVAAGEDGIVRLWARRDSRWLLQPKLEGHTREIVWLAFSPDGQTIVTTSKDGTARLWPLAGGMIVLQGHTREVSTAAFSPDGELVATGSFDRTVRIWGYDGTSRGDARHDGAVRSVVFSSDSQYLLSASRDKTARLWDRRGREVCRYRGHGAGVTSAVFSPNGDRILTGSGAQTAVRMFARDGTLLEELGGHTGPSVKVRFAPDRGLVLTTSSGDATIGIFDLSGRDLPILRHPGKLLGCLVSPHGDGSILTGCADGVVRRWDRRGKLLREYDPPDGDRYSAFPVALSPGGERFLVHHVDGTLRIWSTDGDHPISSLRIHDRELSTSTCASLPRRGLVVIISDDGTLVLHDASGKRVKELVGHTGALCTIAVSPDERLVLSTSRDGMCRVWNVDSAEQQLPLSHEGVVWSASFAPDSKSILTACADGTARLWDLEAQQLQEYPCGREVLCAAFSPDGETVLTGLRNGAAKIWRRDGREICTLRGHRGPIWSAAFSPDGERVVTTSTDGNARVWLLRKESVLELSRKWCFRDLLPKELARYRDLLLPGRR